MADTKTTELTLTLTGCRTDTADNGYLIVRAEYYLKGDGHHFGERTFVFDEGTSFADAVSKVPTSITVVRGPEEFADQFAVGSRI